MEYIFGIFRIFLELYSDDLSEPSFCKKDFAIPPLNNYQDLKTLLDEVNLPNRLADFEDYSDRSNDFDTYDEEDVKKPTMNFVMPQFLVPRSRPNQQPSGK